MNALLLRGGLAIDAESGLEAERDILIEDGHIEAIERPGVLPAEGRAEITAAGWWVVPGLIDVHVHLRDPGFPNKETIESGLKAAAAGGFTGIAAMANTNPVNDSPEITAYMLRRAAEVGGPALYPVGAVSKGLAGRENCNYETLARAGARMFSDDGMPVDDQALLLRALHAASALSLAVSLHEEERELAPAGAVNAGWVAERLGVGPIPDAAESERVRRDLAIAIGAGVPVHIAHVSTAATLELIIAARRRGASVSCEVTPHHFALDESEVLSHGPDAKMNPPLRARACMEAVRAAIADGTIDIIATDHAPHDLDSKGGAALAACFAAPAGPLTAAQAEQFTAAANGIIGLETSLGLALELVHQGLIGPKRLVEMMALNPARLLRLEDAGRLFEGGPADITVIDPRREWRANAAQMRSLSRNTPFNGRRLIGRAVLTLVNGEIIYDCRDDGKAG